MYGQEEPPRASLQALCNKSIGSGIVANITQVDGGRERSGGVGEKERGGGSRGRRFCFRLVVSPPRPPSTSHFPPFTLTGSYACLRFRNTSASMILSGAAGSGPDGSRRWSFESTSMPEITRPKQVWWPLRCPVGRKVRKNLRPARIPAGVGHAQAAAEMHAGVGAVAFAGGERESGSVQLLNPASGAGIEGVHSTPTQTGIRAVFSVDFFRGWPILKVIRFTGGGWRKPSGPQGPFFCAHNNFLPQVFPSR